MSIYICINYRYIYKFNYRYVDDLLKDPVVTFESLEEAQEKTEKRKRGILIGYFESAQSKEYSTFSKVLYTRFFKKGFVVGISLDMYIFFESLSLFELIWPIFETRRIFYRRRIFYQCQPIPKMAQNRDFLRFFVIFSKYF